VLSPLPTDIENFVTVRRLNHNLKKPLPLITELSNQMALEIGDIMQVK